MSKTTIWHIGQCGAAKLGIVETDIEVTIVKDHGKVKGKGHPVTVDYNGTEFVAQAHALSNFKPDVDPTTAARDATKKRTDALAQKESAVADREAEVKSAEKELDIIGHNLASKDEALAKREEALAAKEKAAGVKK